MKSLIWLYKFRCWSRCTTFDLVIQSYVVSAANLAYENNVQLNYDAYSDENDKAQPKPGILYVAVYLDLQDLGLMEKITKLFNNCCINNTGKSKYICSSKYENSDGDIVYNENSGRVCKGTLSGRFKMLE